MYDFSHAITTGHRSFLCAVEGDLVRSLSVLLLLPFISTTNVTCDGLIKHPFVFTRPLKRAAADDESRLNAPRVKQCESPPQKHPTLFDQHAVCLLELKGIYQTCFSVWLAADWPL